MKIIVNSKNQNFLKNIKFKFIENNYDFKFDMNIFYINKLKNFRKVFIKNYFNNYLNIVFLNKEYKYLRIKEIIFNNYIEAHNFKYFNILEKIYFFLKKKILKKFTILNLGPSIKFIFYKDFKNFLIYDYYIYPYLKKYEYFYLFKYSFNNKEKNFLKFSYFNFLKNFKFSFYSKDKFLSIFFLHFFLKKKFKYYYKILNFNFSENYIFKYFFHYLFKNKFKKNKYLNKNLFFLKINNFKEVKNISFFLENDYKSFFIFLNIIFFIFITFLNFFFNVFYD